MFPRLLGPFLLAAACAAQVPSDMKPNTPPAIPDWVSVESNISYGQYAENKLDILRPKEPAAGRRPGVLLIHGGGWTGGTKESRIEYAGMQYLKQGFVVATVQYRLAGVAPAPAAVTDVLNAAAWFRKNAKNYGVDPNRIVVTGDSAGGHLALMVGMTPRSAKLGPAAKVAAVVNFYGITQVDDQLDGPNMRKYAVTWVPEGPDRFALARRVSPMSYVRRNVPPILTVHGDADKTVPYEHGANLTRALDAAGAPATLHTLGGEGHSVPKARLDAEYEEIWVFLKRHRILQ
ncbi:MAG: alpha/beta hydrolase [Bryobacterales bacterium]|nr:alpha/beta hydrolase [Bryobacterales bacterium]